MSEATKPSVIEMEGIAPATSTHQAAIDDADADMNLTKSTYLSVLFLGFTFQPSLTFTVLFVFPMIVPIALDLQGTTNNANWMAAGWSLTGSIAFALAGQLSDYFGRRHILMAGQTMLIVGHIVGATASTLNQCIAAMVILGFGTGTTFVLYPGISEILPNKFRPYGLAWTELNLLPFTTLAPLLARLLPTWRWIFYLGINTGVISIVGTGVFYFPPVRPLSEEGYWKILAQMDYLGILFYISGLTLFLLGLGWANTYGWTSIHVLLPLILGACLFMCTFLWGFSNRPKRPFFPRRLFGMFREYSAVLIIIFVTGVVYFTLTALMPQQIAYTLTNDPTMIGIYNIPGGFGGAAGGVFLGGLISRIKHVQWQLTVGVAVQTIFAALQAICRPGDVASLLVFQLFANIPFAWLTLACYITVGLHVPQQDLGLALGLVGTFRFLGSAVGTTVFTTILNSKANTAILANIESAARTLDYPLSQVPTLIADLGRNTLKSADLSAKDTETFVAVYKDAWSDAFRLTWLVTIPFGIVACIIAMTVRDPSPYFTNHTAVALREKKHAADEKSTTT